MRLTASVIETLKLLDRWRSASDVYTTRDTDPSSTRRDLNRMFEAGYLVRRASSVVTRGLPGYDFMISQKGRDLLAGKKPAPEPEIVPEKVHRNPWEQLRYPHLEKGGVQ